MIKHNTTAISVHLWRSQAFFISYKTIRVQRQSGCESGREVLCALPLTLSCTPAMCAWDDKKGSFGGAATKGNLNSAAVCKEKYNEISNDLFLQFAVSMRRETVATFFVAMPELHKCKSIRYWCAHIIVLCVMRSVLEAAETFIPPHWGFPW